MLTSKTWDIVNVFVSFGTFLGCLPYRWENKMTKQKIIVSPTPWRWYIYTGVITVYGIFVYWRLFESLFILGHQIEKTVIHMFYAISYVFYWAANSSHFFRKYEIAEFITCIMDFDKKFERTERVEKAMKTIEIRVIIIALSCAGRFIFEGPCFLFFSKNRNFIFSAILPLIEDEEDVIFYKVLFAVLEFILSAYTWTCSFWHTLFYIIFTNVVPVWCNEMEYQQIKERERPLERRIFYRSIQMFINMFNDCFQNLAFLWEKFACCLGMIICLYGTLRFYGKIDLLGYLCLPASCVLGTLYIYLIFPKAAQLSDSLLVTAQRWRLISMEVIQKAMFVKSVINSLGQPKIVPSIDDIENLDPLIDADSKEKKQLKYALNDSAVKFCKTNEAFIRSCPFIGVNVSLFYRIGRSTTFTFMDLVINQTINLLMAF